MPSRLPTDLLKRSPEQGSRLLALHYLEEISEARDRLVGARDSEALHDFRVGLRRLRSCIRAYRQYLEGSVSRKMRRRLRKLTVATNSGRDTEVELGWLNQQIGRLRPEETQGLAWLIGRLEGRKYGTSDPGVTEAAGRFAKAAAKLRPGLETFQVRVRAPRGGGQLPFGRVAAGLIRSHAAKLAERLSAVGAVGDMAEAHAARICAKLLRYLLEPLARRASGIKPLVDRLKELQDLLGNLHDMHVMAEEIRTSIEALSAGSPGRTAGAISGLLALEQLAHTQAEASFRAFEAQWADGRAEGFFQRTDDLCQRLSDPDQETVPRRENSPVHDLPLHAPLPSRSLRLEAASEK